MNAINNMTLFDFVGDDIWTASNRKGGSRRSDYEVKLTLSEKSENANKGQRVTLTLRGNAYDATRKYNRVWVSSFNKLGNENVIILKVSEAKEAPGSYALSRASKSDGSTQIQFVAPKCDLEQYANWHGGFYKLKPLADDVFYIQLSDREA